MKGSSNVRDNRYIKTKLLLTPALHVKNDGAPLQKSQNNIIKADRTTEL